MEIVKLRANLQLLLILEIKRSTEIFTSRTWVDSKFKAEPTGMEEEMVESKLTLQPTGVSKTSMTVILIHQNMVVVVIIELIIWELTQ